ncbi:MAG: AMP-binding protein [Acidimicrobiia bacterium]|nr:AMP-binding protein [Acidimicrobiia bacterium]
MEELAQQPWRLYPAEDPDALAIRMVGGGTRTWDELETRARRVARALGAERIEAGGAFAVLAENRLEWGELHAGNARAGTRLVPLNWHLTARELSELLTDSGAQLLISDEQHGERGREAAALAGIDRFLTLGEEYEGWLASFSDEPLPERAAGSLMLFTGGTTGRSKGVDRSDRHSSVTDWPKLSQAWARLTRMPAVGRSLVTTPLYHALGGIAFQASLAFGVPVVVDGRFDAPRTLQLIEEHRITTTAMVPTQFIRLLKLDDDVRQAADVSSLEWVLHTAAPCPDWAKRAMIDWFGPVIYELYGSSEGTGPAICDSEEWLAHPGTVGRASAAVEYSIVDDDGHDLPTDEIGTIYCRRFDGAPEYHGDPEKTAAMVLPDGRFTVGDLGWLDEEGFLYLADRRVDLIISRGSNIYPAEIEGVLVEHPTIADAAVFGLPHPEWGQSIIAVLEPVDASTGVDTKSVLTFVSERLAAFKVPDRVDVVEKLPREAHGKLKKRLLRDRYLSVGQ